MNKIKCALKQLPVGLLTNIIWSTLLFIAPAVTVFITSIFSNAFQIQYVIIAVSASIISIFASLFLFFRYFRENYSIKNDSRVYIIHEDGTATNTAYIDICPNPIIKERILIKGEFDDLPDWSDPIIKYDGSLLGSCVDKENPVRFVVWSIEPPASRKHLSYSTTRVYNNIDKNPELFNWTLVVRKTQSLTLLLAVHKNIPFNEHSMRSKITDIYNNLIEPPKVIKAENNTDFSMYNDNHGGQINSSNYNIFKCVIPNPRRGWKYWIEGDWDHSRSSQ